MFLSGPLRQTSGFLENNTVNMQLIPYSKSLCGHFTSVFQLFRSGMGTQGSAPYQQSLWGRWAAK